MAYDINDLETATIAVGLRDTTKGLVLGIDGEPYPRVHITPQGEFLKGTGAGSPVEVGGTHARNVAVQNAQELLYTYPNLLNFGAVEAPPLAVPAPHKGVDIVAHFYNDSGRRVQAVGPPSDPPANNNGPNGYYGWYDWRDFRETGGAYDASRYPLLGLYAGDDADVLDWICHGMVESGVTAVSMVQANAGFSNVGWTSPTDQNYCWYQLLYNTPNMRSLKAMYWSGNVTTTAAIEASHDMALATIADLRLQGGPEPYTYTENGVTYLCMFMWDLEAYRGVYDGFGGPITNSIAALKALAAKCRAAGFGGVMMMARNGGVIMAANDASLLPAGVLLVNGGYDESYAGSSPAYLSLYANYAATAVFPTNPNTIVNVMTAAKTKAPHPSSFPLAGSTPQLFATATRRAMNSISKNNLRPIITFYGTGEWAEGGPGFIAQRRDGFGYLDAVRSLPSVTPPVFNGYDVLQARGSGPVTVYAENMRILAGAVLASAAADYKGLKFRHSNTDVACIPIEFPADWVTAVVDFVSVGTAAAAGNATWGARLDDAAVGVVLNSGGTALTGVDTAPVTNTVHITRGDGIFTVNPSRAHLLTVFRSGFSGFDTAAQDNLLLEVRFSKAS